LLLATVGAFLAAAIYGGIAYRQWRTMDATFGEPKKQTKAATDAASTAQNALNQARDQFQQDQRPYIWFTNNGVGSPQFHTTPNTNPTTGHIVWDWHYTNYGKSPAYGIQHIDHYIKIGDAPFVRSYKLPERRYRPEFGYLIPPGKDDFSTIVSRPEITPEEYARLLRIDRGIAIKAHIRYLDGSGTLYETGLCESRLATGAIGYCDQDNYVRELPKPKR
jgi:hypothetical protein